MRERIEKLRKQMQEAAKKLDFMDARRVFNQLIELGIIESCQSPYHVKGSPLRRVLMHSKEDIAMLIEKFS